MLRSMSPQLARNGRSMRAGECLFLGEKRSCSGHHCTRRRAQAIVAHVAAVKAARTGIALCRAQVAVFQRRNRQRAAPSGRTIMPTRRKFIGTTLVAGAALTTSVQQARPQPASKRTIVDAQVHFWKASSPDWPWEPGVRPQLPEPFTIERALPMMDEAGVDRVVIVPPGLNNRNDYALEAAKRYPNRFGVMGRIPLQDPKSAALLPTWKQQPGMLGVRVTFNTPPTLAWLSDGTADWFWPAAEKAGLAVMFLAVGEVPRFAHIAERHPQLTLIIDHMGLNSSSRTNRITENIPAAIDQAIALTKYRTSASSCRVRSAIR